MLNFLLKIHLLLILTNKILSSLCSDKNAIFKDIKINDAQKINVSPDNEFCFKYKLNEKKKISLNFINANSYTGEVVIYKNINDIKKNESGYISPNEKYLIAYSPFKEIDVSTFQDYVYIIIRDSLIYYFFDYIILYDSEVSIPLEEGNPLTMNNFMTNGQYTLTFKSSKNVTIVYTSEQKGQKSVNINGEEIEDKNDIIKKYNNSKNDEQNYIITITNKTNVGNQKFHIVYYENIDIFKKIDINDTFEIKYLTSKDTNFTQNFYYYVNISEYENPSTVNFRLDYKTKDIESQYINIYTKYLKFDNAFNPNDQNTFETNDLDCNYDINSDEYLKAYFNSGEKNNYRYILINININELNYYKFPKSFNISIGGEVQNKKIDKNIFDLELESYSYIPSYTKFTFDNSGNYLLNIPYEDNILLIKGDLLNDENKQNTNYINNLTDLFVINGNDEVTLSLVGYNRKLKLNIEKYNPSDVIVVNEGDRSEKVFSYELNKGECNPNKMKYLIFIYNIENYSNGDNPISKYWTSNVESDLRIYYKNNVTFEKDTIFPFSNSEIEKEVQFSSNNSVDIFTINCSKPGTFYIRPIHKTFKEITHQIEQNTFSSLDLSKGSEIIQLSSPIKNADAHIYFSLLLIDGKSINLSPDTPGLFTESTISKGQLFTLEIDTKKYKMDEMAIKATSVEYTNIEITELTDCDKCQYQIIESQNKQIEINKNNFIIFLDKKVKYISITFNISENFNVSYGIVRLPTNNVSYIPTAFLFENETKKDMIAKNNAFISLDNIYCNEDNLIKPYQAFIFSVDNLKKNYLIEYKIQYDESDSNKNVMKIILIVSLSLSLIIAIVFLSILYIKKRGRQHKNIEIDLSNNEPLLDK